MSIEIIIYLAGMANTIKLFCWFVLLCAATSFAVVGMEDSPDTRVLKYAAWTMVVSALLGVAVPTKDTIYLMIGANITKEMAANSEVKEVGNLILERVKKELKGDEK